MIHKLPQYLINKLKAGEIVERPASVVKELIENSLDAGSNSIIVEIINGGKKLIRVEDNGVGISKQDLPLSVERYATSKISSEEDLNKILTYGFRGEALAAISEVSKFKIQSKTEDESIGYELIKLDKTIKVNPIPFSKSHGTIVYVEDIFYNTPVRRKYLKSKETEEKYIKRLFLDYCLTNPNINFKLITDGKNLFSFSKSDNIANRVINIFGNNIFKRLKYLEKSSIDGKIEIYGFISDSSITFNSPDNLYIYVNKRPVTDKILKKAILQAYYRQIEPGKYPFVILFLNLEPSLLDVNVHPRKLEVRYQDPGSIFNFVYEAISNVLSENKINVAQLNSKLQSNKSDNYQINNQLNVSGKIIDDNLNINNNFKGNNLRNGKDILVGTTGKHSIFGGGKDTSEGLIETKNGKILKLVGQIWDTYIILEDEENMYIVDQHALAERIIFEKIRKEVKDKGLTPQILLNPIVIDIGTFSDEIEKKLDELSKLGFDVSIFGKNKIIIYSVPFVLEKYKLDITNLILDILKQDLGNIDMNVFLDTIWATKSCKAAIKAGHKLTYDEMKKLIKDGFEYITGQFVCQHGRPSFVKIPKKDIEKLFDR